MGSIINHTKENIIDGVGYEKGIFKSISQNVILMLIAKLSFFHNLLVIVLDKVKDAVNNDIIHHEFENLIKKIIEIKSQAKERFYKMAEKK